MQRDKIEHPVSLSDAQAMLDCLPDAFFSLSASWEFTYVNAQAERTMGRTAAQLIGKCVWDVFPTIVGTEFERKYRKAAREQVPLNFNSFYPDHERWYEVNIYPTPGGMSVSFHDITERVKDDVRRNAWFALNELFRDLATPEEIIKEASRVVKETLGVARVAYSTIDAGVEARSLDLREGKLIHDSAAGRVQAPVLEKGRLVAVVDVQHAKARNWSVEELAFIKDVSESTRIASERVRNARELAKVVSESERRWRLYETMLENSPDLAYVFGLDHRFTYANKVLLKMWGRSWEEAIGKNCLELGYEPWHAEMHDRELEHVIATKESIRGEVPFNGAFGRRIYEYIFVPVLSPDGEVEAVAGATRDVTERKQAEEGLRESNRRKDEFLAMLAHELRNPLAPISAAAELLQMKTFDEQLAMRTSTIICRQVKHMTALVDDLLDVSRVNRGLVTISKVPVDFKSVVYNAVEQVRPFIETQHHQLQFDFAADTAFVLGDRKRLVQIVTNLLNNAAKYTPPGGAIQMRLEVDRQALALTIEDNGIGMPVELQPHVFELFTQADRTSDRTQGGLGIGLALVKNLTELHGGSIGCFSEGREKGSRFTVSLPRHQMPGRNEMDRRESNREHARAAKPLRVLVVDDNKDAADMLSLFLGALGHQVMIEHTSQGALVCAQREKPDACIIDIGLPEMDGNELARRLRSDQETARALLIAVTGYGQERDKRKSQAAGFDQHLVKPVDAGALSELLEHHYS